MQASKVPVSNKQSRDFGKTFGLVAILTVFSKLVGFVRDLVVASAYGTGALADAYNFAYLYTGNVLILFGGLGGPFHSATVTVLTREKDKPDSGLLMAQVLAATSVLLGILSVTLFLLAPYMLQLAEHFGFAYKGADANLFYNQLVLQLRWMSPLILISGLIGVTYGILNVFNRVTWPSLSPIIASLAIIIALQIYPDHSTSLPLAIATLVGAIGQLAAQLPDLSQCKLPWRFSLTPTPELKQYLAMLWPAALGTLIGQVTTYIDSAFCAQIGEGIFTSIVNSNRLAQLPLGILTTAMLVPMLPRFSELAHAQDFDGLKIDYRRALRFMVFLSIPLTALLITLPGPIVQTLFQRGAFTVRSTALVASALLFLAPQIPFYVGRDLITRVFYAMKNAKTPYYVALVAIAVKTILDWLVVYAFPLVAPKLGLNPSSPDFQIYQVAGMSLATTIITVMNLLLLSLVLQKDIGLLGLRKTIKPLFLMGIAGTLCGALSYFAFTGLMHKFGLPDASTGIHLLGRAFKLTTLTEAIYIAVSCAVGLLAYFGTCLMCKLEELDMLAKRLPGPLSKLLRSNKE
ncbi:MAG: murein biosynthesis integral membrane protein MurJ [Candidatus Obscuribacterales bacterium]|nr:murein biosynthesis integral membrane protein MurJ [Candidatus Obscuribacterales bacterium]